MSTFLAANNAGTTLASTLSSTQTTMAVAVGTGASFPSPNPSLGQYFSMTLIPQTSTTGLPNEIVWVTQVTGDTMTIVRGQEGTTPLTFNVGDFAQNLWTAGQAESLVQPSQAQAQSWNYGLDSGTANAGVVSLTPALLPAGFTGVPIRVLKMGLPNTGAYTLTVNGVGPVSVVQPGGSALIANSLLGGGIFTVVYDGTSFELQSVPGVISITGTAGGDLTGTYPNPSVGQNKVGNTKLAQMAADTVKMNPTGSTANAQDVSITNLWANGNLAEMLGETLKANISTGNANVADVPISTFFGDFLPPYITPAALGFVQNLSSPGYQTIPGGFTIQWGPTGSIPSHNPTFISFDVSFATACFGVLVVRTSTDNLNSAPDIVTNPSVSGFDLENAAANPLTFFFIAIGH